MKKRLFCCIAAATSVALLGTIISVHAITKNGGVRYVESSRNALNEFVLNLNSGNTPAGLTAAYQDNFAGAVSTPNGNQVTFNFVNAKSLENGFAQLANHGRIYNFAAGASDPTHLNVDGVELTGSGTLYFKPAMKYGAGGVLADVTPIQVDAGAGKVDVPVCDFFEMEAGDEGASIASLKLYYSCSTTDLDIKMLNGTYTGVGSDSSIYKLSVTDGSVQIASLDKQTNIQLSGTAELLSKTRAKCTFVYNTYNIYYTMDYDGHAFTFVSKADDVGGAAAAQVAEVSFDRVYNVEDFESYTKTGQGYTNATTKYQTTGLRANYYADFYNNGSGEIGGNNWPVMTSTDNSNYNSQKGHNGSKVCIFKFSNGMDMRYISINELYGVKTVMKGSKISFWARGAYTNTNFNTDYTKDIPMKFYAYYTSPLTSSTLSQRETFEFTVKNGSTWQHFEFNLNTSREYYGFGMYAKQSTGATVYVPFDDIEIYTADPHAEYIAPVAATGVTLDFTSKEMVPGGSFNLTPTVQPADATNKVVTVASSNTNVATVGAPQIMGGTPVTITAVAVGSATITVTTADGGFTATCAITVAAPQLDYPEGTYKGTAVVNSANFDIVISIGNQTNGLVAVRLSNKDAEATGITFNSSTNAISITTNGNYSGATYGTITGTYDKVNHRITGVSCSGTISGYVSNNGNITCELAQTDTDSLYLECNGTTSELQAQFKRRYMSGSWQVDTGNANRITSNTTEFVAGSGALTLKGWNSGAVALNYGTDYASTKAVKNIQYWVYNPSANDISLRMFMYKTQGLKTGSDNNFEIGGVTAKANGWTYVAMGFGTQTGYAASYNFQIADFNNSNVFLTFDNIYLF